MIPTTQFSPSGKTKYFGVNLNGDFVKLQSKKASISLLLAATDGSTFQITNNSISANELPISKITRINSNKLYNYLNQNYVTTYYSSKQSNRNNHNSTSTTQGNRDHQVTQSTQVLRAIEIVPDSVSDVKQQDCLSLSVTTSKLQNDHQQRRGYERVLPTDEAAFYGWGTIEAITRTAEDFFANKPGSLERVEQLRIDIDDARSANLIDDEIAGNLKNLFRTSSELAESTHSLAESTHCLAETKQRFANESWYIELQAKWSSDGEQRTKASTKKHSNCVNQTAFN